MLSLIESLHGAGHTSMHSPTWVMPASTGWSSISPSGVSSAARWCRQGTDDEAGPDIYRYLLVSFDLQAEQCLFIDDSPANVTAAQALGIGGLVFTDAYSCRQQLVAQGYLPA